MYGPTLETARLILRPPRMDEAGKFVKWFKDTEVTKYLSTSFVGHNLESQKMYFNLAKNGFNSYFWAVADHDNEVIGSTDFHQIDRHNKLVVWGIVLADKTKWGQGYGQEVLRACLKFAFSEMVMDRFELSCYSTNERGLHCYRQCGFVQYGVIPNAFYSQGGYADEIKMAVDREDWEKMVAKSHENMT